MPASHPHNDPGEEATSGPSLARIGAFSDGVFAVYVLPVPRLVIMKELRRRQHARGGRGR